MNSSDKALATYQRAVERLDNHKATLQDRVFVALWAETVAQAKMIREMALKISMLEMKNDSKESTMRMESFSELMGRVCPKPTVAKSDATP